MKTLVICAHWDDESISCGGLIAKRVDDGHDVKVVVMFDRNYPYSHMTRHADNERESSHFAIAQKVLGFKRSCFYLLSEGEPYKQSHYRLLGYIEEDISKYAPDEVIIHGGADRNQDHRFLNEICDIALRPSNLASIKRVLEMLPMDGGGSKSQPNYFVPLTRMLLDRKLRAVGSYETESREVPHPRCPENIEAWARIMGSACGSEYAEGYVLRLQME